MKLLNFKNAIQKYKFMGALGAIGAGILMKLSFNNFKRGYRLEGAENCLDCIDKRSKEDKPFVSVKYENGKRKKITYYQQEEEYEEES